MHKTEYFKLNGVDVGFFETTDVRVRRGKVRVWLKTPTMALLERLVAAGVEVEELATVAVTTACAELQDLEDINRRLGG